MLPFQSNHVQMLYNGRQDLARMWPQPASQPHLPPFSLTHDAPVTLAFPHFPNASNNPPSQGLSTCHSHCLGYPLHPPMLFPRRTPTYLWILGNPPLKLRLFPNPEKALLGLPIIKPQSHLYFSCIALITIVTDKVTFVCLYLTSGRQFPLGKENIMCCGPGCGSHSPVGGKGRVWGLLWSRERERAQTVGKPHCGTFAHKPPDP